MENSENSPMQDPQDNTHPTPIADPGAEIETVIPSAENEAPSTEDNKETEQNQPVDESSQNVSQQAREGNDNETEPDEKQLSSDKPVDSEEDAEQIKFEGTEPHTDNENKGTEPPEDPQKENGTDEHGIETVTP